MGEWSASFTIIALIIVLLALGGSWMAVRVLRGRRPRPTLDDDAERERR